MELIKDNIHLSENQNKDKLLRMLDRGIDDMESGRELPLEEAAERSGNVWRHTWQNTNSL